MKWILKSSAWYLHRLRRWRRCENTAIPEPVFGRGGVRTASMKQASESHDSTRINRLAIEGQISEYWRLILTQPFE